MAKDSNILVIYEAFMKSKRGLLNGLKMSGAFTSPEIELIEFDLDECILISDQIFVEKGGNWTYGIWSRNIPTENLWFDIFSFSKINPLQNIKNRLNQEFVHC